MVNSFKSQCHHCKLKIEKKKVLIKKINLWKKTKKKKKKLLYSFIPYKLML